METKDRQKIFLPDTTWKRIEKLSEKSHLEEKSLLLTVIIIGLTTLQRWVDEEDE